MPTEWWTAEDYAPPKREFEAQRQVEEAATVRADWSPRPRHVKQSLLLPRGFWKGAAHVLILRFYEDGTWTIDDAWSFRSLL
jgi:hypothetical protein